MVRHTEVFRQAASSQIITSTHLLRQGKMPELRSAKPGFDFHFVGRDTPASSASVIVRGLLQQIRLEKRRISKCSRIMLNFQVLRPYMSEDPELNRIQRRRMRYAERKLREAQLRLARTERSILYWSRILADLRYERTRAVQSPLWPEDETENEN